MIKVNCNNCINCDKANDRCIPYGSNPDVATRKCAENGFEAYVTKRRWMTVKRDLNRKDRRVVNELPKSLGRLREEAILGDDKPLLRERERTVQILKSILLH